MKVSEHVVETLEVNSTLLLVSTLCMEKKVEAQLVTLGPGRFR